MGVDYRDVGDVYTDPENPVELGPSRSTRRPCPSSLGASTSPLVGRDGDIVGARQLKERLFNETENNVTMKIEELEDKGGVEVSNRVFCTSSILIGPCAEGFEFQVGRPRVLVKRTRTVTRWSRRAGRRSVPGQCSSKDRLGSAPPTAS